MPQPPTLESASHLLTALSATFPRIWRCAVSGSWTAIRKEKLLSFQDFDPERDYRAQPVTEGRGKKNITPWVEDLKEGDLIFLLDKRRFYGIALARSTYDVEGPFLLLKGSNQPAIRIDLLYETEKPVLGSFSQLRVPATFSAFGRAGFQLEETLDILKKEAPKAIEYLHKLVRTGDRRSPETTPDPGISTSPHALNTILYGPPGTGKTYQAVSKALEILQETGLDWNNREAVKERYNQRVQEGRIVFTTFHQSMSYEDFIEGIKPVIAEGHATDALRYTIEAGIFKQLTGRAMSEREHPFVLIIDEINRGNVSQIFGELISLLEADKRLGKAESLTATLPYSKETFGVPPNLCIIGTMNTADRSVEALDTALRRRFSFEEMPPNYDLEGLQYEISPGVKAADLLRTINHRIEKLLDRDHVIGHAYFLHQDAKGVRDVFYRNVLPLLQEYFFGDHGKIGLVLGQGFIRLKKWAHKSEGFAHFPDYEHAGDFHDRELFEMVHYNAVPPPDYELKIGNTRHKMNFEKAVHLLMKQPLD